MYIVVILETILAMIAGIVIAVRTKKADGVIYGKLDKAGWVTNIVLLVLYIGLSPLYLFLGMLCRPGYGGLLAILGWIVSFVVSSASVFCFLGLGFSVALRKKGKSRQSFAVQFAGVFGIILAVVVFCIFYGNLLAPLN